jgi:very-short-patch-repair endonuclease
MSATVHRGAPPRLTTQAFISRARARHGDLYDYSGTEYVVMTTKVTISCREHGVFDQAPNSHLNGAGCPICGQIHRGSDRRLGTSTFVSRARALYGDRFDYSQVEYTNQVSKVTIICRTHGAFMTIPTDHLRGRGGCLPCFNEIRSVTRRIPRDVVIERAVARHGAGRYDYSHVEAFTSTVQPVTIICPLHGRFSQSMSHHARGDGCPTCNESHGEREVEAVLRAMGVAFVRQFRHPDLKLKRALSLDFALAAERVGIEFDGEHHHHPVQFQGIRLKRAQELHRQVLARDAAKNRWAVEQGWRIIRLTRRDDVPAVLVRELGYRGDVPRVALPPMASMAWMPRQNAHALVGGARPILEDGNQSASTAGPGQALCTCTAKSPMLPSGRSRRAWHREHQLVEAAAKGMVICRQPAAPRSRRLTGPVRAAGKPANLILEPTPQPETAGHREPDMSTPVLTCSPYRGYLLTEYSGHGGDEKDAFTATLTRNDSQVATVSNPGHGGSNLYRFAERTEEADYLAYAAEFAAGGFEPADILTDRLVAVVMLNRARVVPILFADEDFFDDGRYRAFGAKVSMGDALGLLAGRPGAQVWVKTRSEFVSVAELLAA